MGAVADAMATKAEKAAVAKDEATAAGVITEVVVTRPAEFTPITIAGVPVNKSQLERDTGFTRPFLTRIFNGKRCPSLPAAKQIAGSIGVSMDELYDYLEERGTFKTAADRAAEAETDGEAA